MGELPLPAVIIAALVFTWTNGFHDTANAVATSLTTGSLTPRVAFAMAALLNGVGALLGVEVANTVSRRLLIIPVSHPAVLLVFAALLAAIGWNLITWWWGAPSSSTHALLGALAGAGWAAGARIDWRVLRDAVLIPTLLSPALGFVGAFLLIRLLARIFRDAARGRALRGFRIAQTVSAAATALGHGVQDGQKAIGVTMLALIASARLAPGDGVPLWVRLGTAVALAAGTAAGGWSLIKTIGRRIVIIDPVSGFAAETVAAVLLYAAAWIGAPISSTHTIVASVAGAGSANGLRNIKWTTMRRIGAVWVATPLITASVAAALYALAS